MSIIIIINIYIIIHRDKMKICAFIQTKVYL